MDHPECFLSTGKVPGINLPPVSTTPKPPPPFDCKNKNYAAVVMRGNLLLFQVMNKYKKCIFNYVNMLYTLPYNIMIIVLYSATNGN